MSFSGLPPASNYGNLNHLRIGTEIASISSEEKTHENSGLGQPAPPVLDAKAIEIVRELN
jgi:hypothetical protein